MGRGAGALHRKVCRRRAGGVHGDVSMELRRYSLPSTGQIGLVKVVSNRACLPGCAGSRPSRGQVPEHSGLCQTRHGSVTGSSVRPQRSETASRLRLGQEQENAIRDLISGSPRGGADEDEKEHTSGPFKIIVRRWRTLISPRCARSETG